MRLLFCDIDDTMTTGGLVPRETFDALWDARAAGLRVVPVTGRPAGWCDHIARMWPIDGVIGENDIVDATTLPKVQMPNRDGFVWAYREPRH